MSAGSSGKISLALGGSKKPGKPAPTNGVKRSHAALHDGEEDDSRVGKAQEISHFDKAAGGAIDEKNKPVEKAPLVIQPLANRDWREASHRNKRQRGSKADGPPGQENREKEVEARMEAEKPVYGLNIGEKAKDENGAQANGHAEDDAQMDENIPEADTEAPAQKQTADEEAMDALLGRSTKKGLVVPAMTEEEAFSQDYKSAPEMASLEDYDRVPVADFGAAMLRGMGWVDGEGIGAEKGRPQQKTKIPERRPALLGIGAKEEAAVTQEMGTWGKAAKDKKGPVQIYNPVLLRDKKTGEMYTEEELEKKKQKEEKEKYEMEFEESEKRKEKERRRRDRSGSRDRERRDRGSDRRDRDSDPRRERRDRDDRDMRRYDSDEEYYRRKEKDKRRRERDREDRHRDRDRHHNRRR